MKAGIVAAIFILTAPGLCIAQQWKAELLPSSYGAQVVKYVEKHDLILKEKQEVHRKTEEVQPFRPINLYTRKRPDFTKYGVDLIDEKGSDNNRVRLRGGVSKISKKASAGVQLIVGW